MLCVQDVQRAEGTPEQSCHPTFAYELDHRIRPEAIDVCKILQMTDFGTFRDGLQGHNVARRPMVADDPTLPRMAMIQAAPAASTASSFNAASLAQLFSVLSHEIRLEILELLSHGEMDVSSIAEALELPMGAVSHHLVLLRKAGLVRVERCKTRHVYSLTTRVDHSIRKNEITMELYSAGEEMLSVAMARRF